MLSNRLQQLSTSLLSLDLRAEIERVNSWADDVKVEDQSNWSALDHVKTKNYDKEPIKDSTNTAVVVKSPNKFDDDSSDDESDFVAYNAKLYATFKSSQTRAIETHNLRPNPYIGSQQPKSFTSPLQTNYGFEDNEDMNKIDIVQNSISNSKNPYSTTYTNKNEMEEFSLGYNSKDSDVQQSN